MGACSSHIHPLSHPTNIASTFSRLDSHPCLSPNLEPFLALLHVVSPHEIASQVEPARWKFT